MVSKVISIIMPLWFYIFNLNAQDSIVHNNTLKKHEIGYGNAISNYRSFPFSYYHLINFKYHLKTSVIRSGFTVYLRKGVKNPWWMESIVNVGYSRYILRKARIVNILYGADMLVYLERNLYSGNVIKSHPIISEVYVGPGVIVEIKFNITPRLSVSSETSMGVLKIIKSYYRSGWEPKIYRFLCVVLNYNFSK